MKSANALHDNGDFLQAADAYEAILASSPSNAEARANYAGCLVEIGEYEKAVEQCDALSAHHQHASVMYTRAEAHFNLKNIEQAEKNATSAINKDPLLVNAFCLRAACRNARGDYAGAVEDLDVALELRPTYSQASLHRGVAHYKLGNHAQALRDLRKASLASPAEAAPWIHLASARMKDLEDKANAAAQELLLQSEGEEKTKEKKKKKKKKRKKKKKQTGKKSMSDIALKQLHNDLFAIEVSAIVDTVFAVSTARVVGKHSAAIDESAIDESFARRMADQLQSQTRLGMVRMLHQQYVNEKIARWFRDEKEFDSIFNQYH